MNVRMEELTGVPKKKRTIRKRESTMAYRFPARGRRRLKSMAWAAAKSTNKSTTPSAFEMMIRMSKSR